MQGLRQLDRDVGRLTLGAGLRRKGDLGARCREHPGERGALDLLLPGQAQLLGIDTPNQEVGAYESASSGLQDLCEGIRLDTLHARHARPPARKVVGVADELPELCGRRVNCASATDERQERSLSLVGEQSVYVTVSQTLTATKVTQLDHKPAAHNLPA
jgi:hypothetical protein